jgi:hypothetical protein
MLCDLTSKEGKTGSSPGLGSTAIIPRASGKIRSPFLYLFPLFPVAFPTFGGVLVPDISALWLTLVCRYAKRKIRGRTCLCKGEAALFAFFGGEF